MANRLHRSDTYVMMLEMLCTIIGQTVENSVYSSNLNGLLFTRIDTGSKSHRVPQNIAIVDTSLYGMCDSSEWAIIGRILGDLREYNALWIYPVDLKNNGNAKKAIRSLLIKGILRKTETTDIYLVNPFYIRRGDYLTVLATTANTIKDAVKITPDHVVNKRPVKQFNVTNPSTGEVIPFSIGYGYHHDETHDGTNIGV